MIVFLLIGLCGLLLTSWMALGGGLNPITIGVLALVAWGYSRWTEMEQFAFQYCDCLRLVMELQLEMEMQPTPERMQILEQEMRAFETSSCLVSFNEKKEAWEMRGQLESNMAILDSLANTICPEVLDFFPKTVLD